MTVTFASLLSSLSLAVALAADSFFAALVVKASARPPGGGRKSRDWSAALLQVATFAIVQMVFFWSGFEFGSSDSIPAQVQTYDHWVAFGVLTVLSAKIFKESFARPPEIAPEAAQARLHSLTLVIGLAAGTSIDAIGAGMGLGLLDDGSFKLQLLCIGAVTALFVAIAHGIGHRLPEARTHFLQRGSAALLLGIAVKILVDHHAFRSG